MWSFDDLCVFLDSCQSTYLVRKKHVLYPYPTRTKSVPRTKGVFFRTKGVFFRTRVRAFYVLFPYWDHDCF